MVVDVDEFIENVLGPLHIKYDTDWDKAKPLSNNAQFDTLQRMSLSKLDMVDWD